MIVSHENIDRNHIKNSSIKDIHSIMQSKRKKSTYWLDNLLLKNSNSVQYSLEDKMNYLSFIICCFFFVMLTLYPFKTAISITIFLLFTTTITYYSFKNSVHYQNKENYNEDNIEDYRRKKEENKKRQKTLVKDLSISYSFHKNDLHNNKCNYKQILPNKFLEDTSVPSSIQNKTMKAIVHQTPLLSLEKSDNHNSQNFLLQKQPIIKKKSYLLLPENETFHVRENYLFPSSFSSMDQNNIFSTDYSNVFHENTIGFRDEFSKEVKNKNRLRETQMNLAPTHRNF